MLDLEIKTSSAVLSESTCDENFCAGDYLLACVRIKNQFYALRVNDFIKLRELWKIISRKLKIKNTSIEN